MGLVILFHGESLMAEEYVVEEVEVIKKDDITKLTENFEDSIRKLQNAKATLSKAEQHHKDAVDLVNQATENYNVAITSIELYQGQ